MLILTEWTVPAAGLQPPWVKRNQVSCGAEPPFLVSVASASAQDISTHLLRISIVSFIIRINELERLVGSVKEVEAEWPIPQPQIKGGSWKPISAGAQSAQVQLLYGVGRFTEMSQIKPDSGGEPAEDHNQYQLVALTFLYYQEVSQCREGKGIGKITQLMSCKNLLNTAHSKSFIDGVLGSFTHAAEFF
ncbi:unnamed protein product [Darwinula stevensoni]|uniref:Uncharacterized protein n=1 Tax=Darwinula stevensoni TaxID=69355 RepID=A0A7R9FRJ5_9CRUS|nr:unnamed protein product [Darwinula stevensoni]CAG0901813.1 unnamed protein product [Darwinula stevensoni]